MTESSVDMSRVESWVGARSWKIGVGGEKRKLEIRNKPKVKGWRIAD
jgi:hypothetical protein